MNRQTLLESRKGGVPSRLAFLAIGTMTFILSYYAGTVMPLSPVDAEVIRTEFLTEVEGIDEAGIFLNNIAIALGMFVPGAGVGVGVSSGISTGTVYNAFAQVTPELQSVSPLAVLATPFGVLEVLAYGLAMSRSGMLVAQLWKSRKEWKRFTLFTLVEVGVVVVALVAGSLVESQVIQGQES